MWNLRNCRLRLAIPSVVLLMLLSCVAGPSDTRGGGEGMEPKAEWILSPYTHVPLAVKLDARPKEPLIPGLFADHVHVVVRNHTEDQAVAIRNVKWWEGGRESLNWHGSVFGASIQDGKGEIIVELNETVQALSSIAFEKGLLLPGDELTVYMPFTPQKYDDNTLQIHYVAVGDETTSWEDEVLIPRGLQSAGPRTRFVEPSEEVLQRRNNEGGMGLLRSTMAIGAEGAAVKWGHFSVPIPIEKDPDPQATGGLTLERASGRAGAHHEDEGYLGYYLPKMQTWFFIRGDDFARTLRLEDDKWVFDFMKNIPAFAPDFFGRGEAQTAILLNPDIFGEIVEVQTPWRQMYYNPGKTYLDANELWQVLQLTNANPDLDLQMVVINPNGLGKEWVLTIGVEADSAGKWIEPAIEPREVPLNPR